MKLPVPRRIFVGFLLAAIILAGTGVLLYRVGMQFRENRASVGHAREVLDTPADLSGSLEDAETSVRVYVLTGDSTYLVPYDSAISTHEASLEHLRSLIGDDPAQLAQFAVLRPHVETGLADLATPGSTAAGARPGGCASCT